MFLDCSARFAPRHAPQARAQQPVLSLQWPTSCEKTDYILAWESGFAVVLRSESAAHPTISVRIRRGFSGALRRLTRLGGVLRPFMSYVPIVILYGIDCLPLWSSPSCRLPCVVYDSWRARSCAIGDRTRCTGSLRAMCSSQHVLPLPEYAHSHRTKDPPKKPSRHRASRADQWKGAVNG